MYEWIAEGGVCHQKPKSFKKFILKFLQTVLFITLAKLHLDE